MSENKNTKLQIILELYKEYIADNYVYKVCNNSDGKRKWIVILHKFTRTKTNEERSDVVNNNYAKFRANKLQVIKIFDMNEPTVTIDVVKNKYIDKYLEYAVNKIVHSDYYDDEINRICTGGIHYFKTIQAAYYYGDVPENYTGEWFEFYDNGNVSKQYNFIEGHKTGEYLEWYLFGKLYLRGFYNNGQKVDKWTRTYKNGQIKSISNYGCPHIGDAPGETEEKTYDQSGKLCGKYIEWYDNKKKRLQGEYFNDQKTGKWTKWYESGNKEYEGTFMNGDRTGEWYFWYENSNEKSFGQYLNDQKTGKWFEWFDNKQKSSEGRFTEGHKIGYWIEWYENGIKKSEGEYENGRKTSKWNNWHENGKIKPITNTNDYIEQ